MITLYFLIQVVNLYRQDLVIVALPYKMYVNSAVPLTLRAGCVLNLFVSHASRRL